MSRRHNVEGGSHRHLNRRQWLSALGVGSIAGLAGCSDEDPGSGDDGGGGGGDGGSGDEDRDTYDTAAAASFETLNPIYNTENGAGVAIARALDQGYTFNEENEVVPLLYDLSTEDGEVWTFEVRDNLEFSDPYGQVTAEDFVYLIQEVHQSDWANSAATINWGGVDVEQTGELEFQATLESANLLWPETFDPLLYPIPRDLIEPYVEDEDVEGMQQDEELLELTFSGNLGPYVMDEWNRGSGTQYSRNDDYYLQEADDLPDEFDDAPYFEGGSITYLEEQSSRLGALETGEVDSAAIPPERYEEYDNRDDVYVNQVPTPYNTIISVNMRDNGWTTGPGNLFRHKEFRQAVNAAISKQDLIDGVYRGLAQPHYTWQPRFTDFYPGDDDLPQFGMDDEYGRDFARSLAQEAIDQSEYDYEFDGDELVDPDGNQVELDIYHSAGQETSQLTAEFISEEMGENLGIDVSVEAIDGTRFGEEFWTADPAEDDLTDEVNGEEVSWDTPVSPGPNNPGPRSATSNEDWDMSIVYGLNTYPRNPLTNQVFFDGANAQYNPVGYYPEFDAEELFAEMRQATDRDELISTLEELFINLAEEQPYIMLLFSDDLIGYREGLEGPIENFSNGWDLPVWTYE